MTHRRQQFQNGYYRILRYRDISDTSFSILRNAGVGRHGGDADAITPRRDSIVDAYHAAK